MNQTARHSPDATFDAQLDAYLGAMLHDDCFRVDAVLKQSAAEVTQRVFFVGANGAEQGPYVRKYLRLDAHVGDAYRAVYQVRRDGRRFRYLPDIYECHEAGDRLVVVMEHVCGATLRTVVENTPPERRVDLASQVFPALCAAASELHESFDEPLVHRDLTPSNVMCVPGNPSALTVIDLGIARLYRPEADADTAHFGTRPYAPPEQFGFSQTDARTDVYALGLVLFFCLTGRDATPVDRGRSYVDPSVPEPLRAVIARAASFDPAARPAGARVLGEAFDQAMDETRRLGEKPAPFAGFAQTQTEKPALFAGSVRTGQAAPSTGVVPYEKTDSPTGAAQRVPAYARLHAEGTADPGAPGLRALTAAAGALAARIPAWLGRLWNATILLIAAFLAFACVFAVVEPVPANASWPLWFRLLSYAVFLPVMLGAPLWLFVDKRRLARRFPVVYRRPFWRRALRCAATVAVAFALYVAVGIVSGVAMDSADAQAGPQAETSADVQAVRIDDWLDV